MANAVETAEQAIREARRENHIVALYPDTEEEARQILETLGVEASDDCGVWDHQSGAGYSGNEALGHYDVWGEDWRIHVITAEVSS